VAVRRTDDLYDEVLLRVDVAAAAACVEHTARVLARVTQPHVHDVQHEVPRAQLEPPGRRQVDVVSPPAHVRLPTAGDGAAQLDRGTGQRVDVLGRRLDGVYTVHRPSVVYRRTTPQPAKLKSSYDHQQTWPPPRLWLLTSTKLRHSTRPACSHVCWGRSASQSTASNAYAVVIGRREV